MTSEPTVFTKGTGGDVRVLRFPEEDGAEDPGVANVVLFDELGRHIIDLPARGEVHVDRTDRLGLSFQQHQPGQTARYLEATPWGTYERVAIESGNVGAQDLRAVGRHGVTFLSLGWSGHDRNGNRHAKPLALPDDAEAYAELRALRGLVVHVGGFGDDQLRGLGSRSWLNVLVLAGTHVTTGALARSGLGGVEDLWLSDDESISDDLDFLRALPALRTLGLRNAGLRDRYLRKLTANPHIVGLDLGHNRIGGATLDHLAVLDDLRDLDFTGTVVSDTSIARLTEIRNLERLRLGDTPLGDAAVPHLGRLGNVTRLWLTRTYLTDAGLGELVRAMPQLRILDISQTRVTVDGLRHLRHLPNLWRLEIAPSQLTEESVEMLAETTTIKEIGLRGKPGNLDLFGLIADAIGAVQGLPDA